MGDNLKVKAGPNGPVFRPELPRVLDENSQDLNVIRDTPVEVPNTRYYRGRIAAGDLVLVTEPHFLKTTRGKEKE